MNKILVIDDNLNNLEYISEILKIDFPKYQMFLSQSGIEGIEIAKRELPDTILLDILMPVMDGFEVCNILKNNNYTKHIPIVFLSALNERSFRIKGLNVGADAYISKPFNRAELEAQVKVMLRIKFAEDLLRKRNENLEILIKKKTADFDTTENRYLKVSEYALEYFWQVDQNMHFTYVSPVIERILGFSSDEIIGKKSLFDLYIYHKNTESKKELEDIFARRENFKGNEVLCLNKDGDKIWLSISGFPYFDDNNTFSGYIGVNHDITRRRIAEEANKEHLKKINEYQKKLKKLYYELTIAEEKERRKIAEYMHDGFGQTISIAAIKLSSISSMEVSPEINMLVQESAELLRNAIRESRTLVYDLFPPILYEFGLVAAIKWKLEQIEKKFGISTILRAEENPIELNSDLKILIFRMVSELLNNILKHAEAGLIIIEIRRKQDNFLVSVIDDGKGFDYIKGKIFSEFGGFGLFSISERLGVLQGTIEIDSELTKGTKITLTVPIKID